MTYRPSDWGQDQVSGVDRIGTRRKAKMTDDQGTNPKDLIGKKKPMLWLVPSALLIIVSKVMELGAKKYGPYNWRTQKVQSTVYITAAMRHLLSSLDGEDIDPESGQPHIAHADACCAILLDAQ